MRYIIGSVLAVCLAATVGSSTAAMQTKDEPEVWGGTGIMMSAAKDWVTIEMNAAMARIPSGIKPDKKGRFSVRGTYDRSAPGAIRMGASAPESVPARFEGTIKGKIMTLRIVRISNGEVIGKYTLEQGKRTRIIRLQ